MNDWTNEQEADHKAAVQDAARVAEELEAQLREHVEAKREEFEARVEARVAEELKSVELAKVRICFVGLRQGEWRDEACYNALANVRVQGDFVHLTEVYEEQVGEKLLRSVMVPMAAIKSVTVTANTRLRDQLEERVRTELERDQDLASRADDSGVDELEQRRALLRRLGVLEGE